MAVTSSSKTTLNRRLTLPLLVLYGLGVTVGAGIYVLIGAAAAEAGMFAPVSFLIAATVVAFTGFSYAELSTRFPVSAGEAVYVENGLKSKRLATLIGLMVAASGIVSAAAICIGAASYLGNFVPVSPEILTAIIILCLGFAAAWGILESVTFASILTVLEILGLVLVVIFSFIAKPDLLSEAHRLIPPLDMQIWGGIGSATLLAFFAFVGFEDLANVAEEAIAPERNMPRAIILTLVIATLVYLLVVSVVVLAVPVLELSQSDAPLDLVFSSAPAPARLSFNLIAAFATVNGVLIQTIMASRVLYGMASNGQLNKRLAYVHPRTRTPIVATALVVALVLFLALALPIGKLAEVTSQIALATFAFVNIALVCLKRREPDIDARIYRVPIWCPVLGALTCIILFVSPWIFG